jgi:hypothetical protein
MSDFVSMQKKIVKSLIIQNVLLWNIQVMDLNVIQILE